MKFAAYSLICAALMSAFHEHLERCLPPSTESVTAGINQIYYILCDQSLQLYACVPYNGLCQHHRSLV